MRRDAWSWKGVVGDSGCDYQPSRFPVSALEFRVCQGSVGCGGALQRLSQPFGVGSPAEAGCLGGPLAAYWWDHSRPAADGLDSESPGLGIISDNNHYR